MILFDEHPHEHLRGFHRLQVAFLKRRPHQRGHRVSEVEGGHLDVAAVAGEGEDITHETSMARVAGISLGECSAPRPISDTCGNR